MTIGLLSAHGTWSTGTGWSCPLPAGIAANSWAYLMLVGSATGPTLTVTSAGWNLLDAQVSGTTSMYLYAKSVGVADSSTTVSGTWSVTVTWNSLVAVASGENLDNLVWTNTATAGASLTVPAITPAKADCLDLILGTHFSASSLGPVSATPPAGFTEDQDYSTVTGGVNNYGVYLAHRQLTGQAGVAQSATTMAVTPNSRAGLWRIALAPGTGVDRSRDARLSGQALSFTTGSRNRDARLSGQALIGPPQKTREARLSAQVLTYTAPEKLRDARLSAQVLTYTAPEKLRTGRVSAQVLTTEPAAPATGFDGWGIPI